jgi:hypothetical protein
MHDVQMAVDLLHVAHGDLQAVQTFEMLINPVGHAVTQLEEYKK